MFGNAHLSKEECGTIDDFSFGEVATTSILSTLTLTYNVVCFVVCMQIIENVVGQTCSCNKESSNPLLVF